MQDVGLEVAATDAVSGKRHDAPDMQFHIGGARSGQ